MLAYVFWHTPVTSPAPDYAGRLRAFHRTLNENRPSGLLESYSWAVGSLPWLDCTECFEDWYVLQGAYSLDALAGAAVSERVGTDHEAIAQLAGAGIAGLYRPARQARAAVDGPVATWFGKPSRMSYDDFYARLDALDPSTADRLWQRFLTLGPAGEFCLVGDRAAALPDGCQPVAVSRSRLT